MRNPARVSPTRHISVQTKPKKMSFGVFIASVLWCIGETTWNIGTSIPFLIAVCVLSFIVDRVCTGSSTRQGVYID